MDPCSSTHGKEQLRDCWCSERNLPRGAARRAGSDGRAEPGQSGLGSHRESGAGKAGYPDAYVEKGAKILPDRAAVFAAADIVVQVLCYGSNDVTGKADLPLLRRDQVLIGFLRPLGSLEVIQQIAATGVTSFAVELMPRTTRAQSMDALSSMGTICGYKAVLIAADTLPRFFPC